MRMSEKYLNNNNSDNPLTSRRTDGGKNIRMFLNMVKIEVKSDIFIRIQHIRTVHTCLLGSAHLKNTTLFDMKTFSATFNANCMKRKDVFGQCSFESEMPFSFKVPFNFGDHFNP